MAIPGTSLLLYPPEYQEPVQAECSWDWVGSPATISDYGDIYHCLWHSCEIPIGWYPLSSLHLLRSPPLDIICNFTHQCYSGDGPTCKPHYKNLFSPAHYPNKWDFSPPRRFFLCFFYPGRDDGMVWVLPFLAHYIFSGFFNLYPHNCIWIWSMVYNYQHPVSWCWICCSILHSAMDVCIASSISCITYTWTLSVYILV